MGKEKIYEFAIDRPLTPARRKAVEKQIKDNAHLSPMPVSYNWDEEDDEVLHIEAKPVLIEVRFQDKNVELYGTAPLWARLLFTNQKKSELKDQIQSILQKTKFIVARKPTSPKAKSAADRKSTTAKAKSGAARNSSPPPEAKSDAARKSAAAKAKPDAARKSTPAKAKSGTSQSTPAKAKSRATGKPNLPQAKSVAVSKSKK
jgi:hypothetical protein